MPDCIYRFSKASRSVCVREPSHLAPCLEKACCVAVSHGLFPQFRPAMRGRLKFSIQTNDPRVLEDPRILILREFPHLRTVFVAASEEDIVQLVSEKGSLIQSISKAIPFRLVR